MHIIHALRGPAPPQLRNREVVLDKVQPSHTVYLYNCKDTTVQVRVCSVCVCACVVSGRGRVSASVLVCMESRCDSKKIGCFREGSGESRDVCGVGEGPD